MAAIPQNTMATQRLIMATGLINFFLILGLIIIAIASSSPTGGIIVGFLLMGLILGLLYNKVFEPRTDSVGEITSILIINLIVSIITYQAEGLAASISCALGLTLIITFRLMRN